MDRGHWTPPNRGVTNLVTSLNYGMGAGDHSGPAATVPATNGISRRRGDAKSVDPGSGTNAHRSQRTTSAAERFGPAGIVQVARVYHGSGCPDCAGRGMRTVPSAFSSRGGFSQGSSAGK